MTDPLTIHIPGEPRPQGSKKAFVRGRRAVLVEANPGLKAWRTTITLYARKHAGAYTGERPLHVTYLFTLTKPKSARRWLPWVKPDLDKLLRAVNDGIGDAKVWDDDGRITAITASKTYATPDQPPGVTITIREETQ
ncbi:RusA family crossover junction endodeoxyribonuclease [Rothia nasimurium]|uniref:RusA family crossover junction endodeoxyribonuclease n=1 Tax=Rothia nasimurium TaxID=85336 RepID=UPI001F0297CE|nr:RusA family crossover junction endodeoxyribonuclease [Rothia nasimurium]